MMDHTTRKGAPRLLRTCTLPLTAPSCVTRIYTDLAVISREADGFLVHEIIAGLSREELQARTGAPLRFADDCGVLAAPDIADKE